MLSRASKLVLNARSLRPMVSKVSSSSSSMRATSIISKRLQSTTTKQPEEVFTKITDENDPQRDAIFSYTWGTWLRNDKVEKAKRKTVFSIQGLNEATDELFKLSADQGKHLIKIDNGKVNVISKNLSLLGDLEKFKFENISQIVSIHEGKHHRIYKITLKGSDEKSFVLRIPYRLDSEYFTSRKVQSEAATMDFAESKLGLKVPKVLAYSGSYDNALKTPFILMEYKEGDLLMRSWNPLLQGAINEPNSKNNLMSVIDPLADFNEKLISVNFNKFGSLYFKEDCPDSAVIGSEGEEAYAGETDESLRGRWVIGPTTERQYYKGKLGLKPTDIEPFVGPWKLDEPLKIMEDLIKLEIINLQSKLSLLESDSNYNVEEFGDKDTILKSIEVYQDLLKVNNNLFNLDSNSGIPNYERLIKANLSHPDLDPMNVIKQNGEDLYLLDFESTSIKPFLLSSTPQFVSYTGPKIFDLSRDVEDFDKLDEIEKQQYEFMFYKTRNQFYWDLSLNNREKELMGAISIKLLKAPYLAILTNSHPKDYLYVKNGLLDLTQIWEQYRSSNIVKDVECPLKYEDEAKLEEFMNEFSEFQLDFASQPFYATKGWVPQDMFQRLLSQGLIIQSENGDYKINTEQLTKEEEPETPKSEETQA